MLVLSKKPHEAIPVEDEIRIIVMESTPHRERIATQSPDCMPILQEELWLRRQEIVEPGHCDPAVDPALARKQRLAGHRSHRRRLNQS